MTQDIFSILDENCENSLKYKGKFDFLVIYIKALKFSVFIVEANNVLLWVYHRFLQHIINR